MERETGPEAAVQRLGEQWIRELAQPGGGSFVCSPAGLWLALTAVASGARGGRPPSCAHCSGWPGPKPRPW